VLGSAVVVRGVSGPVLHLVVCLGLGDSSRVDAQLVSSFLV